MNQGLARAERLKSRKQISQLFSKNNSTFSYPFKLVFSTPEPQNQAAVQLLISVSKRTFKLAVDRNRMKRLIRETYRKHKTPLTDLLNKREQSIRLGVLFVGKELMDYQQVEKGMIKALKKLEKEISSFDL